MYEILIARRDLATSDGDISVEIRMPKNETTDMISYEYRVLGPTDNLIESAIFFGADSVQALLFCLTAVGDYLHRFEPSASFADLGISGFPRTVLGETGQWVASVSYPHA